MKHTFTTHQTLNITTGFLYTEMGDIYKFFNDVVEPGIMTHMLPNSMRAIEPILRTKLPANLFDIPYTPEIANEQVEFEFTDEDKKQFFINYEALPHPFTLLGKDVPGTE